MGSDEDYAAFLDKANEDSSGATTRSKSKKEQKELRTTESGVAVPKELSSLDAYYVSEADEPFEGVALKWEDGELNEGEFLLCPPP